MRTTKETPNVRIASNGYFPVLELAAEYKKYCFTGLSSCASAATKLQIKTRLNAMEILKKGLTIFRL